jgi:division protein CdvB (Snf7/Vps24/ESCRT-III family)
MNEAQLKEVLRKLAHDVVRNELAHERVMEQLSASPEAIGATMREVDAELKEEDDDRLRTRFPELFETT